MKRQIYFFFVLFLIFQQFNQVIILAIKKSENTKKIEKLSNDILNYLVSQFQAPIFKNKDLKVEIEACGNEKLKIEDLENINSYFSYPDKIFIGENLFKLIENEAELAAVICHELGHAYYSHIFSGLNLKIESEADIFAINCLKEAKYEINSLKTILEKLFKLFLKKYPTLKKVFSKRIETIDLYIKESKINNNYGNLFILFNQEEFKNILNPAR